MKTAAIGASSRIMVGGDLPMLPVAQPQNPQVAQPVPVAMSVPVSRPQGVLTMVPIPAGVVPGGQFQAMTPSGAQMLVTCPEGSKSGDQIQFMAPPPSQAAATAVDPGPIDAVAQYEAWLGAAARVVMRREGGENPTRRREGGAWVLAEVVETIALAFSARRAASARWSWR